VIADATATFLKEVREQIQFGARNRGQVFGILVSVVVVNVVFPIMVRHPVAATVMLMGMAGMYVVMMGAFASADVYAGERERHTLPTLLATRVSDAGVYLGKLAALLTLGVGAGLAQVVLGTLALLVFFGTSINVAGSLLLGLIILVASLPLALLMTSLGLMVSARSRTVRGAMQVMPIVFMAFFLTPALIGPLVDWRMLARWLTPQTVAWLIAGLAVAVLMLVALFVTIGLTLARRRRLLAVNA
jgi:ABC-2 type transport system permease protein